MVNFSCTHFIFVIFLFLCFSLSLSLCLSLSLFIFFKVEFKFSAKWKAAKELFSSEIFSQEPQNNHIRVTQKLCSILVVASCACII